MIFDVFEVELDKGTTIEIVFMGVLSLFLIPPFTVFRKSGLKGCFKGRQTKLLTCYFRSLSEKPSQDKKDFTVVEQYPPPPTSIAKC